MKNILLIIVFICCVFIGISIKNFYKKRKLFYYNLKLFCDNLINEISYNNEKLELILSKSFNLYNKDFTNLINDFYLLITNQINQKTFNNNINKNLNFLNESEKCFVYNFFNNLGGLTKDEEIQRVCNLKLEIERLKNETFENDKKFSNLYFKLFIILGMVVVIFFI